jgi:hypothetical protein
MKVEFDWHVPEANGDFWVVADVGRRTDDVWLLELRLNSIEGFVLDVAILAEKHPAAFRKICERARKEADERLAEMGDAA